MLSILKRYQPIPVIAANKKPKTVYTRLPAFFQKAEPAKIDLYFGGQFGTSGLQRLKELGITAIVNMRSQSLRADVLHEGFKYLHLPTPDNNPPSLEMLIKGADFIHNEIKSGGKVYINCLKGRGRGPTMAIAYLIRTGKTFEEAYELVSGLKPDIAINHLQTAMLHQLESFYRTSMASSV